MGTTTGCVIYYDDIVVPPYKGSQNIATSLLATLYHLILRVVKSKS